MRQFQEVYEVNLSEEESSAGLATAEHVASSIAALHRDGIVIINNAVDPLHAEALQKEICSEIESSLVNGTFHFNTVSILQEALDRMPPCLYCWLRTSPDIVTIGGQHFHSTSANPRTHV